MNIKSNRINALFEDPRIAELRAEVALKTDAIPFMLLPVRIETRFKKVPRKGFTTVSVESLLEGLGRVHVLAIDTLQKPNALNLRSLTAEMAALTDVLRRGGVLLIKEKGWMKQLYNDLKKDIDAIVAIAASGFATEAAQLTAALNDLEKAINAFSVSEDQTVADVRTFIYEMERINANLQVLTGERKSIPYLNIKNKKDLYNYITNALDAAISFYSKAETVVKEFKFLASSQLTRILELQTNLKNIIAVLPQKVGDIHREHGGRPDAAWQQFSEGPVTEKAAAITAAQAQFEETVLPLLKALPQPPAVQTGELLTHGIQTLIKIKKFNASAAEGYEKNKRFKKYIQPRIATLLKTIASPIVESKPGQAQVLKNMYSALNADIQTSAAIVGSFAAKNNSQKFGLTVIDSFIREKAIPAFGAITGGTEVQPFPGAVIIPKTPQMQPQLWVRIYPDDIFVDAHEEALTENELTAGKRFWKVWWAASYDTDLENAAWKTLCAALGTKRASWVARQLKPLSSDPQNATSLAARPSAKITDSTQVLNTSYDLLKALPLGGTALKLFETPATVTALEAVLTNVDKAVSLIKTLSGEQDYLVEKAKSAFIKGASFVNQLIDKSKELTAEQIPAATNALAVLEKIVTSLDALQNGLATLPPILQKDFVAALPEPFIYPEVATKSSDWTAAPHCRCLPDRFVVITIKDGQAQHAVAGNPVPPDLPIGLNPQKLAEGSAYNVDEWGDLIIEDDLKWMTDYEAALEKGMAVTLNITQKQWDEGFDKVVVLGIKNSDAATTKTLVEDLFTNHIYAPDGMGFLKVATPTNNTKARKSGYQPESDVQQRYDLEISEQFFATAPDDTYKTEDGKILSDALGLDAAVLRYANDGRQTEIANAWAANRLFWHGSMGHYMEEMFDGIFTYDNIERTEAFFTAHCLGRGRLPSIRVGIQPYGVLPTTAFSQLQVAEGMPAVTKQQIVNAEGNRLLYLALNQKLQQRFDYRLHRLLNTMYTTYQQLCNQYVVNYSNLNEGEETLAAKFTEMLCLHPVSLNYTYRQSVNVARGPNCTLALPNTNFTAGDIYGPNGMYDLYRNLMYGGVFYPSFNFYDESTPDPDAKKQQDAVYARIRLQFESSRQFGNRFFDLTPDVTGPIADSKPVNFTDPISTIPGLNRPTPINYIEWLLETTADTMLAGNDPARMPSQSLLFLMLRQSLLQAYQEAACAILQTEGMISEDERRLTGSRYRYHFRTYDFAAKKYTHHYITKWHLLFKFVDQLPKLLQHSALANAPFYQFLNGGFKSVARYLDQLLAVPLTSINPPELVGLNYFNASHRHYFQKLHTVRYAMNRLKHLPAGELEILLGEHVDITTHRLDTWLLGLVNRRLEQQRAAQPQGLFLGAYGYVENLRPDGGKQSFTDTVLENFKLKESTVYHDAQGDGFIHAASVGQAITAAVLRSAYSTNTEAEDEPNRLSVNLSSGRVRMALRLIEGMRNGQSVGALLGFQFERGLHERYKEVELDKFIQPFRKAFPLKQQVEETAGNTPAYESLVVDGDAVLDLAFEAVNWLGIKSAKTLGELLSENNFALLPAAIKSVIDANLQAGDNAAQIYDIIIDEIDRMADALDALGDLATSESVYQIVKGNYVRAAAVLDALAQGKNLPEPEVIDTYRNGIVVSHRVVFNLATNIQTGINSFAAPAGWPTLTPRATAEPSFNAWLGTAFGHAAQYKCVVRTTSALDITTIENFSLDALGWQAIDLFCLAGGAADLHSIIAMRFINAHAAGTKVSIDFSERGGDWGGGDKTIAELFYLIKTVQRLFANSRYAGAADLQHPDAVTDMSTAGAHDTAELEQRTGAAVNALKAFIAAVSVETYVQKVLSGTLAPDKVLLLAADYTAIAAYMQQALLLGIPSAVVAPYSIVADSDAHFYLLFHQLLVVLKDAQKREAEAIALQAAIAATDKQHLKVEKGVELAKIVFGKAMPLLPVYAAANAADINTQLLLPDAAKLTRHGGPLAVESWLQGVAKVRQPLKDLQQYYNIADMFETALPQMQPVQLPFATNDYWLGMEYPSDYNPDGDKVSIMLLQPGLLAAQTIQAGLVIDEWLEIIPAPTQTSGIVFNYNQPNATPPQSILVAVTPSITAKWEWDDLVHTIIDTVELSKIRAVEPDHLDHSRFSHALHAVVSEIPPPQVSGEDPNALGVQAVMDFSIIKQPVNP